MHDHDRPCRQYTFRKRNDRSWVAKRLAAGIPVAQVASVERASEAGIRLLCESPSFQRLLGGWVEHQGLPHEDRLARLIRLAMDVMELGLLSGDRKVGLFVLDEARAKRDPSVALAAMLERRMARAGDPSYRRPEPPPPPAPLPRMPAEPVIAAGRDRGLIAEVAASDLSRHMAKLRHGLLGKLERELEREITADARPVDAIREAGLRDRAAWGAAHDAVAEADAAAAAEAPRPEPAEPDPVEPLAKAARSRIVLHARYLLAQHLKAAMRDRALRPLVPDAGRVFYDAYEALGP